MASIKRDLMTGVFWNAVAKYSGFVLSMVVSMTLARLLTPAEYGVVAAAAVIITFLGMFCSMGLGPAVIQNNLSGKELNSVFTFSVATGSAVSLLFFCLSWPIADFYGNSQLVPICQILSIPMLFSAFNIVPNALMSRDKRFKELARRSLVMQCSTGLASVLVAWRGGGVYALLIGPVISSIGIYVWNRRYYKLSIDRSFDLGPVKRIFSFSFYQFLFEFVNYFSRNLDKLIVGRVLGLAPLGIYEKAYMLMHLPMNNITFVIGPVMQPVMRELENDKAELAKKYAKIVRFLATLSFPIGIIMACMSREVIHILFGGQWDAAIPILSILSLSLPLQMILSTSGPIYMICNNTKMQFWLGIRNTVTTVAGFIVAAFVFKTLEAIAWAWTITLVLNFAFTYWLMYRYVLRQPIWPMLAELVRPAIIAVVLAVAFLFLNAIDWYGHLWLAAIVKGVASITVALVSVQALGQYDLIGYMKSKLKHRQG